MCTKKPLGVLSSHTQKPRCSIGYCDKTTLLDGLRGVNPLALLNPLGEIFSTGSRKTLTRLRPWRVRRRMVQHTRNPGADMRTATPIILALLFASSICAQDARPRPAAKVKGVEKNDMGKNSKAQSVDSSAVVGFLGLGIIAWVILTIGVICIELVPWVVAVSRGHNNSLAIFFLCLFFGWSCIGWCVAFIWAMTDNTNDGGRRYRRYDR